MARPPEFPPKTAMVLAAGLGLRMRPVTESIPKALVSVAGRTLIDRTLDRLHEAGIEKVVVNVHYLADMLEAHLEKRKTPEEIILSDERDQLLETGGGIRKALPLLGDEPFFAINCDIIWQDNYKNTLRRLASRWSDGSMDALLLMIPTIRAAGYDGNGDYQIEQGGRLVRRKPQTIAPYLFGGVQILHPRLFEGCGGDSFSLNRLYDRAQQGGRLFGLRHEGRWMHVGTPAHIEEAEQILQPGKRV